MFSFKAIIASRGYHVYKDTTWSNAKVGDEVKVEVETDPKSIAADPCVIKAKHSYFNGWKTVGHIPREISSYVYFFLSKSTLKLLKYKASPIPSGGLEITLSLKFSCKEKWVTDTMEEFVNNFYSYEYAGHFIQDSDENDSD